MSMANGDIDEGKKYVTKEIEPILDMAKGMAASRDSKMPTFPDYKFELVKKEINGDKAKVTYKDPERNEETMDLIKEDGSWKVHMEK